MSGQWIRKKVIFSHAFLHYWKLQYKLYTKISLKKKTCIDSIRFSQGFHLSKFLVRTSVKYRQLITFYLIHFRNYKEFIINLNCTLFDTHPWNVFLTKPSFTMLYDKKLPLKLHETSSSGTVVVANGIWTITNCSQQGNHQIFASYKL